MIFVIKESKTQPRIELAEGLNTELLAVLDTRQSFSHMEPPSNNVCSPGATHWEVFTGGGCRGDSLPAFGWTICATTSLGTQRFRCVARFGYGCLEGNNSSFVGELLGLERAADFFARYRLMN